MVHGREAGCVFGHVEEKCNASWSGHEGSMSLCCQPTVREVYDPFLASAASSTAKPWPVTPSHCNTDSFGRDSCSAPTCINFQGYLIQEGEWGVPLIGWPDLYTGQTFDPMTQLSMEQQVEFDFPRGFRWRSMSRLSYEEMNDQPEHGLGMEPTKNFMPWYGFRAPKEFMSDAFQQVDGRVLIMGWPSTANSNVYHFLQYALSALTARWRYNIGDDENWSLVVEEKNPKEHFRVLNGDAIFGQNAIKILIF